MSKPKINVPSKYLGGSPKESSSLPEERSGPKGPKLPPGDRLGSTYMSGGKSATGIPTDAAPKEQGKQGDLPAMKPLTFGKGKSSGPNAV